MISLVLRAGDKVHRKGNDSSIYIIREVSEEQHGLFWEEEGELVSFGEVILVSLLPRHVAFYLLVSLQKIHQRITEIKEQGEEGKKNFKSLLLEHLTHDFLIGLCVIFPASGYAWRSRDEYVQEVCDFLWE